MERHLTKLRDLLAAATAAIQPDYFLLPVADGQGGQPIYQYRERVYAYELYHQLRVRWPDDWPYSLGGEVDKHGHPVVRGEFLDDTKPDLLVHVPGRMDPDLNLAVLEIKPLRIDAHNAEQEALRHDLQKLIAFLGVGYYAGFLLVFGEPIQRVRDYAADFSEAGIDLTLVELWHHRAPGEPAHALVW